jgi:hypothetical protein
MKKAGSQATIRKEPALTHSFMRARMSKPAMAAFEAIAAAIRPLAHEGVLEDRECRCRITSPSPHAGAVHWLR